MHLDLYMLILLCNLRSRFIQTKTRGITKSKKKIPGRLWEKGQNCTGKTKRSEIIVLLIGILSWILTCFQKEQKLLEEKRALLNNESTGQSINSSEKSKHSKKTGTYLIFNI